MPEKRVVVFDLNNTLVMTAPVVKAATEDALRFLAKELGVEADKFTAHYEKVFQRLKTEMAPLKVTFEAAIEALINEREVASKWIVLAVNRYRKVMLAQIKPLPGAKDLVGWIKDQGGLVAVVTGGDKSSAKDKLKATGLFDYVDQLVAYNDVGVYKPAKEYYSLVMDKLQCKVNQMMAVSDSDKEDLKVAEEMGLKTLKVPRLNPQLTALKEQLVGFLSYAV